MACAYPMISWPTTAPAKTSDLSSDSCASERGYAACGLLGGSSGCLDGQKQWDLGQRGSQRVLGGTRPASPLGPREGHPEQAGGPLGCWVAAWAPRFGPAALATLWPCSPKAHPLAQNPALWPWVAALWPHSGPAALLHEGERHCRVAASITYGCSLFYIRLQPLSHCCVAA